MPPPSFLSGFKTRLGEDGGAGPQYLLACRNCSADSFHVFCYVDTVGHPREFFGYNPGDTILLAPILLECDKCRERQTLFDPRRHGYDAVLNGHCSYACETGELRSADGLHAVRIALSYNGDPAEIQATAKEAGVPAEDLFDSIAIAAISPDGVPLIFEYECA